MGVPKVFVVAETRKGGLKTHVTYQKSAGVSLTLTIFLHVGLLVASRSRSYRWQIFMRGLIRYILVNLVIDLYREFVYSLTSPGISTISSQQLVSHHRDSFKSGKTPIDVFIDKRFLLPM